MANSENVLQKVKFSVKALASSIIARASKGTLFLVVDDANIQGVYTYTKLKKVTEDYSEETKAMLTKAFNEYHVSKVVLSAVHDDVSGITAVLDKALAQISKVNFNGWLCVPQITSNEDKQKVVDFIKTQRNEEDYPIKAVVANTAANYEAIVNFTGKDLGELTSDQYCLDVACVLCTLGANEAITNYTAKNVTCCDVKEDADSSVANGELFLFNNGTSIVFSKGVNSLTTIPAGQSNAYTKIRVIEVIDMVKSDVNGIIQNKYLGKFGNSYKNRTIFVDELNNYLDVTRNEGYLSNDLDADGKYSYAELDVEATREYIENILGGDCEDMTDLEILQQKIDTHVFTKIILHVQDVIENIEIVISYDE